MRNLFLLFFFVSTLASAQDQVFRVISCSGDVNVMVKDSSQSTKLYSGQLLTAQGILNIGENSSVKIISKDKPIILDQKGQYDLESLYSQSNKMSMSFTGKFWQFIMDGLKGSDSKKNMKNYYKDYMAVSGAVKGYVDSERRLAISEPYSGIITEEILHVEWHYEGEPTQFHVFIEDKTDSDTVYHIKTMDTSLDLLIDQELLDNEKQYYLKVVNSDGIYDAIDVSWSKVDEEKVSKRLKSIVGYEEASPNEKEWMRAVVLEMEGYNQQSYKSLQQLLNQNPDDLHLKKLLATFLIRQGEIVEAETLMDIK